MKSKLLYTLICIFFTSISCKTIQTEEDMSHKVFLYHLGVVENFVKIGYIDEGNILLRSIEFLENLTSIKSEFADQHVMLYTPTRANLKDWENWYNKNKDKLYWDENDKKVKLKNSYSNVR